jgi:hypothetical protein
MACWRAALACLTADMAGVRIDMAAALAVAQALGSAPEIAAELLAAIADGMAEAQVKRAKERRDGS